MQEKIGLGVIFRDIQRAGSTSGVSESFTTATPSEAEPGWSEACGVTWKRFPAGNGRVHVVRKVGLEPTRPSRASGF